MQSMSPQDNQRAFENRKKAFEKCGANMGPHNYIPMSWIKTATSEHVSHMMCTICFVRINIENFYKHYPELSL